VTILRSHAKTFVIIGWVVFVVSIPICLLIGAFAGFAKFYFSASPHVTLDDYDLKATNFVLAAGAFATAVSTIALVLKFRAVASASVIVIWGFTLVGTQVARSFVKPGPEYLERHLGREVFWVPWKYAPSHPGAAPPDEISNENGFTADLCLSNLGGRTDEGCGWIQGVRILPDEKSAADSDLESWRKYRSQMRLGPDRSGYQTFDLSYTVQPGGKPLFQRYFARLSANGQLTRLVVCRAYDERFCMHHALVGNYWLGYQAGLAEGDEVLDARLATLIESWRRK